MGVFISLASAGSWLVVDLMMLDSFSSAFIPYLNETFRLIVFLIITFILSSLKASLDSHKQIARTDHLTGIHNRRAFFDLADLELNKARRYQTPISVIYMDIDNFKQINDRHGHHTGDLVLRLVAATVKNHIRTIDIIARFGGDEFGILLAETAAGPAALVAKKLKDKLTDLVQRNGWPVTFSMGVVTFERMPASVDEMLNIADAQMYSAKQNGKNRTWFKVFNKDDFVTGSLLNAYYP